jgi:hypothetical protein
VVDVETGKNGETGVGVAVYGGDGLRYLPVVFENRDEAGDKLELLSGITADCRALGGRVDSSVASGVLITGFLLSVFVSLFGGGVEASNRGGVTDPFARG